MSQVLLRRCIQSSCTVRYHRRWLTQQAVLRSVPDTLRESASGSEPASSTAQPASTPTASSSNCPPTSSRKGRPKVDVFLASLQSSGSQPSLKDLERGRPREHAHPESTLYAKQYNGLIEQLGRSFTKEQLRRFGEQYQLDPRLWRSKKRKVDYARAIVENAWGWPSLRDIEKAKREKTEVLTETFNVSRSQLFLILGKDGSDLLRLANDFSVRISTVPKPLALKVQGLRDSLRKVSERIGTLKRSIVEETVPYSGPEPLPKEYLEKISRLSSAYVEFVGDKLRISAADSRNLSAAKRLINRAAHNLRDRPKQPLLSHIPPSPPVPPIGCSADWEVYSMYPFIPHTQLPWTMGDDSVFRIRKSSDWLTQSSTINVVVTGVLNSGSMMDTSQECINLRSALLDPLPEESPERIRTCSASVGHVLFSHSNRQKTTLLPPVKGRGPYSKILNWVKSENAKSEFVPSVPPFLATTSESKFLNFHRLTYHASGTPASLPSSRRVLGLEIPLGPRDVEIGVDVTDTDLKHVLQVSGTPRMWTGFQSEVDILLPHRPVDIRLSVQDFSFARRSTLPLALQQYVIELDVYLQNQESTKMEPSPPSSFSFQEVHYELHSTESVRRNATAGSSDNVKGVMTETVLDLETSQKASVCLVRGGNPMVDEEWNDFLSRCDKMTTFQHHPTPTNSLRLDDLRTGDINTTQ